MSDDGRVETFAEEDNFLPLTVALVLLIVIATIVVVACILKSTPSTTDLEAQEGQHQAQKAQEGQGQAQMPLRSRLAEYVSRYFNVGDSDAPLWDSTMPTSPMSRYGNINSTQEAHREGNTAENYYTLAVDQSEPS